MDWSHVDYLQIIWCFISCLNSHFDGTHSLQRIHWWASDVKLISLFWWRNKLIYSLEGLRMNTFSADFYFWVNYSFNDAAFETYYGLFLDLLSQKQTTDVWIICNRMLLEGFEEYLNKVLKQTVFTLRCYCNSIFTSNMFALDWKVSVVRHSVLFCCSARKYQLRLWPTLNWPVFVSSSYI